MSKRPRKKKPSKSKRKRSLLDTLKNHVRGGRNTNLTYSQARISCPTTTFTSFLEWGSKLKHKGQPLLGHDFPRSFTQIKTATPLHPLELDKELKWAATKITPYKDELSAYFELSLGFSKSLLKSEYETSSHILDTIEENYGVSFWLIENKLALLHLWKGLEAQKEFSSKIIEETPNSYSSMVAYYVSERNEDSVTPFRFKHKIDDLVNSYNLKPDVATYLSYRLSDGFPVNINRVSEILAHDSASCIIDLYETLLAICSYYLSQNIDDNIKISILETLNHIQCFTDFRIHKLLLFYDDTYKSMDFLETRDITCEDLLLKDNYKKAKTTSLSAITNNPLDISLLPTRARALAALDESDNLEYALLDKATNNLASTFKAAKDAESSSIDLIKLALNFRYLPFADYFGTYALDIFTADIPIVGEIFKFKVPTSPYLDPFDMVFLSGPKQLIYLEECEKRYKGSYYLEWIKVISNNDNTKSLDNEGDHYVYFFGKSLAAVINNDYSNSLLYSEKSKAIKNGIFDREIDRVICHSLINNNQTSEAIDRIVGLCLSNELAQTYLPIEKLLIDKDWSELKSLPNKLTTTILLDFYLRSTLNSTFSSYLRYSYEEFLWSNNLEKPSELRSIAHEFNKREIIYFLRYICVQSVMDVSIIYKSSTDIDNERLNVCVLLADLDKENENIYQEEIRSITTKLKVNEGLRFLDKSKIFVNEEGVVKWANKELREDFNRYKDYIDAGMITGAEGIGNALIEYHKHGHALPKQFFEIPKGESASVFLDIITSLKEAFLSDPEHGLDSYLSMRIRHGTLFGFLRSPLETHHVILQRHDIEDKYKNNKYWEQRFPYAIADSDSKLLYDALSAFSNKYDKLLNTTNKEYIQIKSKTHPKGLFDIHISSMFVNILRDTVDTNTEFDDFLAECFSGFWLILDNPIEDAQKYFLCDFKNEVENLFSQLEKSLYKLDSENLKREICDELRQASTQVQSAIDQVAKWFTRADSVIGATFSIDQSIEIAIETVKRMRSEFNPKITKNIGISSELDASSVAIVCDLLIIVFENISRHSGNTKDPVINLEIYKDNNENLVIHTLNKINDKINQHDVQNRLNNITDKINNGEYRNTIAAEGGTGLIKIKRIVDPDNTRPHSLIYNFTENNEFEIKAILPIIAQITK